MRILSLIMAVLLLAPFSALAGVDLQSYHMTYVGSFQVPDGRQGCANDYECVFSYGGKAMAVSGDGTKLYLSAHTYADGYVAQVNIPADNLLGTAEGSLPIATMASSGFYNVMGDRRLKLVSAEETDVVTTSEPRLGGLLTVGSKLLGTIYIPYDQTAEGGHPVRGIFTHSTDLTAADTIGNYGLNGINTGRYGGYLAAIPAEHQAALGGDVFCGLGPVSIMSRTNLGPAATVFDSAGLDGDVTDQLPAYQLLGYPDLLQTLGEYSNNADPNPYISPADQIWGAALPSGSDTVLIIGRHGTGDWCYKGRDEGGTCTDLTLYPEDNISGNQARPYVAYAWAYAVDDLAAVKSSHVVTQDDYDNDRFWTGNYPDTKATLAVGQTVQYHNLRPYATWQMDTATGYDDSADFADGYGATAYDQTTQRIYVSQPQVQLANPVINVYQLDLAAVQPEQYHKFAKFSGASSPARLQPQQ